MQKVLQKAANGKYTGTFQFLEEQDRVNTICTFEKRYAEVKTYSVVVAAAALDPEYWSVDLNEDPYVIPALHIVVQRLLGKDKLADFLLQFENWRKKRQGFGWEENAR